MAALVTFGSGLLNLFSVMGTGLTGRTAELREDLPFAFINLSRFLTVLIGFALVVSSINIYKRKKRAFQLVLLLACLSIVFHLTKGLDYGEATWSFALVVLLLISRKNFTVRSSIPDLRLGLLRLAIALGVALLYGTAGFGL